LERQQAVGRAVALVGIFEMGGLKKKKTNSKTKWVVKK